MQFKVKGERKEDITTKVTLHDLNLYFNGPIIFDEMRPIIGNYNTRLVVALSWLIGHDSVIIRGASGSAKSEILKAIVALPWGDDGLTGTHPEVYMIDASSDKGNITPNSVKEIKGATHCFIPELQNCGNQEDIIKKWTEDMPYVYRRATRGGQGSSKLILPPLPILTNLADGNEKMGDLVNEMRRRFISVWTIANRKTNNLVHERKALIDALPEEEIPTINSDTLRSLRIRLLHAMNERRRIINPFGIELHKLLPKTFTESNTYVGKLLNFVKCITKFYVDERVSTDKKIFSTLGDNYVAMEIAGGIFKSLSMGIPEFAKDIIDHFDTLPEGIIGLDGDDTSARSYYMTVDQVKDYMDRTLGMATTRKAVKDILDKCTEVGHLRTSATGKSYYKTREYEEVANPDMKIMYERGLEFMKRYYPEVVDEWIVNNNTYVHPFSGEECTINLGTVE